MLDPITFLSLLLFGDTIASLSHPHFATREAATVALKSPLAWPAVRHTYLTTESAEVAWRAYTALPRLPSRVDLLTAWTRWGDIGDLATWLLANPEDLTSLFDDFDSRKLTCYSRCESWARCRPYCSGTLHGDVVKVITSARATLNAPASPSVRYSWGNP
jgi:hypothetical protein